MGGSNTKEAQTKQLDTLINKINNAKIINEKNPIFIENYVTNKLKYTLIGIINKDLPFLKPDSGKTITKFNVFTQKKNIENINAFFDIRKQTIYNNMGIEQTILTINKNINKIIDSEKIVNKYSYNEINLQGYIFISIHYKIDNNPPQYKTFIFYDPDKSSTKSLPPPLSHSKSAPISSSLPRSKSAPISPPSPPVSRSKSSPLSKSASLPHKINGGNNRKVTIKIK